MWRAVSPAVLRKFAVCVSLSMVFFDIPAKARTHRAADRRSRPRRWHDAVAELLALQAVYAAWLEALPDTLQGSATADALLAIVDLDLDTLAAIQPPRGYGRD